jgi:hypothetical protein
MKLLFYILFPILCLCLKDIRAIYRKAVSNWSTTDVGCITDVMVISQIFGINSKGLNKFCAIQIFLFHSYDICICTCVLNII